jgi:DNA helicase HerA-like ATPase
VIDIQALNDKGKRIVFFNVLSRLAALLERNKTDRDQGKEPPLDVVIVFVDELNKFAPSGRAFGHGLKEQVVEIAARGRSVGLILFAAEQFASAIDKEVYGNCSSHLVGRTEYVELADSAYRWISRDLMYVASTLPKGALLCKHALFARPMLIRFPKPLHTYETTEIEEILQAKKPEEAKPGTEGEGSEFERLVKLLKGRSNQSPVSYYQGARGIRNLSMGQSKFTTWYKSWVTKKRYHSGSETERSALRFLMEHLENTQEERIGVRSEWR